MPSQIQYRRADSALSNLAKQPDQWLGTSICGRERRTRATVFASLLAATIHTDLHPPTEYITLPTKGAVNYWLPGSQESIDEPYPDDLDDTAVIVGLRARAGILTVEERAAFVRQLIRAEVLPGGPYKTWCTADRKWDDVDPVVNANIAWALGQCGVTLAELGTYLRTAWEADARSPYYANSWVTRALLSRTLVCQGSDGELLAERLKVDPPKTALSAAAATLVCRWCHVAVPDTLTQLMVKAQAKKGDWPWEALIIELAGDNPVQSSSPLAVTVWCTTALKPVESRTERLPAVNCPAYSQFRDALKPAPPLLKRAIEETLTRLEKADPKGVIAGIARHTRQATGLNILEKQLRQLERATIWGWIAYTMADAQMDGEKTGFSIPAIQWATRQMVSTFQQAAGTDFLPTIEALLTRVDVANSWELIHGRVEQVSSELFPAPSERSIAHLLGPLAILHLAGITMESKEAAATLRVGQAYLALRQHLDDAHDWLDDHNRGIRTPIGEVVRSAATAKTESSLRKAFTAKGAPYITEIGRDMLREWAAATKDLPVNWRNWLREEQVRLANALERFEDAMAFNRALRPATLRRRAPSKGTGHGPQG